MLFMQAGFGVAVQYANQLGLDWIWERVQQLAAELRSKLRSLPGVTVHDRGRLLCGIVSFTKVSIGKDLFVIPAQSKAGTQDST